MTDTIFTETERHMLDDAFRKMENNEDITSDEMQLVIKFTAWKTANDEESKARIETMQTESAARIEESKKTQKIARDNLVALSNAAMEFYERMCANVPEK